MRSLAVALVAASTVAAGAVVPSSAQSQSSASGARQSSVRDTVIPAINSEEEAGNVLMLALDSEDSNQYLVAAKAYEKIIAYTLSSRTPDGDRLSMSLLGLERVSSELDKLDGIVPVIEQIVLRRPSDPVANMVYLRTLTTLMRDEDAHVAYLRWRQSVPGDASPYREYAKLLMARGRALAADSVLRDAVRLMGRSASLAAELAQLHVSMERWGEAAQAYRDALVNQPWLETAALYGLQRAPASARDSIRARLTEGTPSLPSTRLLSNLEMTWGEPRRAWTQLSTLPPNDSTFAAWREFAEQTELGRAWSVSRDAWTLLFEHAGDVNSQSHAANVALLSGDAMGALQLTQQAPGVQTTDAPARAKVLAPIEIAALGELGRMNDAQKIFDQQASAYGADVRVSLLRPLVMGWLRVGDPAKACSIMAGTELEFDDELAGWMALYDGDLQLARRHLLRASVRSTSLTDALGMLARIRLNQSPTLGKAFLALAKHDSSSARALFMQLVDSVGTAAPVLIAQSARISPPDIAQKLRERIISSYPDSPEAPEALLSLARAARDSNNKAAAISFLEKLLIDYQGSALTPQARRELEQLQGQIPPTSVNFAFCMETISC